MQTQYLVLLRDKGTPYSGGPCNDVQVVPVEHPDHNPPRGSELEEYIEDIVGGVFDCAIELPRIGLGSLNLVLGNGSIATVDHTTEGWRVFR